VTQNCFDLKGPPR